MSTLPFNITLPFGAAFNGATELPLASVGSGYGGITVLEAWLHGPSAGTAVGGILVSMSSVSTGGTPAINGTVATAAGTIVTAAGVVHKFTASSTPSLDAGEFIGYDQTSGTIPAGTYISVVAVRGL